MGDKKYRAINNDSWNVLEKGEEWLGRGKENQEEGRLM